MLEVGQRALGLDGEVERADLRARQPRLLLVVADRAIAHVQRLEVLVVDVQVVRRAGAEQRAQAALATASVRLASSSRTSISVRTVRSRSRSVTVALPVPPASSFSTFFWALSR